MINKKQLSEILDEAKNLLGDLLDSRPGELSGIPISSGVYIVRDKKGEPKYEDVPGFCKSANLDEIKKNGHTLTPGRYVGLAEIKDDGIPFEEKMEKLSRELRKAFKNGHKLEKEIEKNLRELGF